MGLNNVHYIVLPYVESSDSLLHVTVCVNAKSITGVHLVSNETRLAAAASHQLQTQLLFRRSLQQLSSPQPVTS